MKPGIIILAAGESARMETPKQLLTYRGSTLLRHAIRMAGPVAAPPVTVVLGAHAALIRAELEGIDRPLLLTENPGWRDGMGGSLRTGLSALLTVQRNLPAALFLVCDQPLLTTENLSHLIAVQERTGHAIAAAEYNGILGVPAVFDRCLFPELLQAGGSEGARQIIRRHRDRAIGVPFPGAALDIDTPADYARLIRDPAAEICDLTSV